MRTVYDWMIAKLYYVFTSKEPVHVEQVYCNYNVIVL